MATRARIEVKNETGLHARPAALFAETAKRFSSNIAVFHGEKKANAKSITSLLLLGINKGASIEIEADGPDEAEAIKVLQGLIDSLSGR